MTIMMPLDTPDVKKNARRVLLTIAEQFSLRGMTLRDRERGVMLCLGDAVVRQLDFSL